MSDFKVGDRVRVNDTLEKGYGVSEPGGQEKYIGAEGVVSDMPDTGFVWVVLEGMESYDRPLDNYDLFMPSELDHVEA